MCDVVVWAAGYSIESPFQMSIVHVAYSARGHQFWNLVYNIKKTFNGP